MKRRHALVSAAAAAALLLGIGAAAPASAAPSASTRAGLAPIATGYIYPSVIPNGRVHTYMTSSSGATCPSSITGNYASVASIALSFGGGIGTATVATVLSVVGLVASGSTTVKAMTCTTERYLWRDGQGYVGYWHTGYRTGVREVYKHYIGWKLNSSTQKWTVSSKTASSPSKKVTSANYSKSDTWLANKGLDYAKAGQFYSECSW